MRGYHLLFIALLCLIPSFAHANIFAQLSYNAGGCGILGTTELQCSTNYKDGLFSAISCKVLRVFNAGIVPVYCSIVQSPAYISAIHATLALFIIIWGISFIIGTVPATTGSAMVNAIKVAFVYFFCTNTDLFFNFLYVTILSAPAELVAIILQGVGGGGDFFSYVDQHFTMLFQEMFFPPLKDGASSQTVDLRLFAMGIAVGKMVPGGQFITLLFFSVISGWLMAYITIMVRYIISIMGLIFLIMLAPIFLPAKLFKAMEYITDEWIKMIVSFIIQIVVVVTFLIMIEPFFRDFLDLVRLGFNKLVLENGTQQELVAQGKVGSGSTVEAVFEKQGPTMATSEKYITQLDYKGNKEEFIPWFVFMLLQATVVIYLSYQFMREVPRFASLIAGNPKVVSMFQSVNDTSFGSSSNTGPAPFEKGMKDAVDGIGKAVTAPEKTTQTQKDAANQAGINFERDN